MIITKGKEEPWRIRWKCHQRGPLVCGMLPLEFELLSSSHQDSQLTFFKLLQEIFFFFFLFKFLMPIINISVYITGSQGILAKDGALQWGFELWWWWRVRWMSGSLVIVGVVWWLLWLCWRWWGWCHNLLVV